MHEYAYLSIYLYVVVCVCVSVCEPLVEVCRPAHNRTHTAFVCVDFSKLLHFDVASTLPMAFLLSCITHSVSCVCVNVGLFLLRLSELTAKLVALREIRT